MHSMKTVAGKTIYTSLYDMAVAYGSPLDQVATYVAIDLLCATPRQVYLNNLILGKHFG